MGAKTGNKAPANLEPLNLPRRRKPSLAFKDFCTLYGRIRTDRGYIPLKPRSFQLAFVSSVFDMEVRPRLASLILGRGKRQDDSPSRYLSVASVYRGGR